MLKLRRLINETGIIPSANQVEMNPCVTLSAELNFGTNSEITDTSLSPISWPFADAITSKSLPIARLEVQSHPKSRVGRELDPFKTRS